MEDYLEILIFLAFAAFSILTRFLESKKKPKVQRPKNQPPHDSRSPETVLSERKEVPERERPVVTRKPSETKQVSFDDILRELMGETPSRSTPPPPVKKAKKKVSEAQQELKKIKATAKKATTIAEKISLEDKGKRIQTVELKDQPNDVVQEVSDALKNPRNAREAIILSEIINRKYF